MKPIQAKNLKPGMRVKILISHELVNITSTGPGLVQFKNGLRAVMIQWSDYRGRTNFCHAHPNTVIAVYRLRKDQ